VVSSCCPPVAGRPVTGGGLRTAQLIDTLREAGHAVVVFVEDAALGEPIDGIRGFAPADLESQLRSARCSVVVVEQWALVAHLGDLDKPLVVDLHGSLLLENVYRRGDVELTLDAGAKLAALGRADLLLAPAAAQLHHFASWATLAGFDPRELPLAALPLAGVPEPPRADDAPGLRLVYGGARWPWIDSLAALTAVAHALPDLDGATLTVCTYEPPRHGLPLDEDLGTWPEADAALADRPAVTTHAGLPHEVWTEQLDAATVALDLWEPNAERLLAATTRTIEFLSRGLPVITVEGAAWAESLVSAGAGWTVPPGDDEALAALLSDLHAHPARVAAASAAATRLVAERHNLATAGEALLAFCDKPGRPPRTASLVDSLGALKQAHLDEDLASAKAAHAAEHAALVARHAAEVDGLRDQHRQEQRDVVNEATASREASEQRHRDEMSEATARHRAEVDRLTADHAARQLAAETEQRRRASELEAQTRTRQDAQDQSHRDAATATLGAHRAEVEELVEQWTERLRGAEVAHRKELTDAAAQGDERQRALVAESEERLRGVVAEWQERQAALVAEWQERQAALVAEWQERQEQLNADWEVRHRQLNVEWEERHRQLNVEWEERHAKALADQLADHTAQVQELNERNEVQKDRGRSDRNQAREARMRLEVELRAEIARLHVELEAATAPPPEPDPPPPEPLRRGLGIPLPGRLGPAARLARLWAEHALDRPRD